MTISFENENIRNVCEDENCALEHFAPNIVRRLKSHLADLEAYTFLSEVSFDDLEEITKEGFYCYAIDIVKNLAVLIFGPVPPKEKAAPLDLGRINRIKIMEIRILK